jgi:phosphocarrier protein FPr/phosphocarrier protein
MRQRLLAPCAGWVRPLEEVCDEAFAARLLGDGLALDPLEGDVRAPCDGVVAAIAPTRHSVTLRTATGVELLIHVGVDTVGLGGDGFEALTAAGAAVRAGNRLLRVDLDRVARRAKSLVTTIVVLTPGASVEVLAQDRLVGAGEPLATVRMPETAADGEPAGAAGAVVSQPVTVPLANGVHARPAARLCAALKPFAARVSVEVRGQTGDARSVTAWLALDIRRNDEILLSAEGDDAARALAALVELVESGMGEADHEAVVEAVDVQPPAASGAPGELPAVRAATGGAVGAAVRLIFTDRELPEAGRAPQQEAAALAEGFDRLVRELQAEAVRNDLAEAHLGLLQDPEIHAAAHREIADGLSAAQAWRLATRERIEAIRRSGNRLLAERAADLLDLERRLIDLLLGDGPRGEIALPPGAIVLADELLPSVFQALAADNLAGVVTAGGGPTSHVAILAAAQGVPMLVAAGEAVLQIAEGTPLLIDDRRPVLVVGPSSAAVVEHAARHAEMLEARRTQAREAHRTASTRDGRRVEVFANCGSPADAARAVAAGAEGCGLLRTEFLFLGRPAAPSEEEQAEAYRAIAAALNGRPLIVRTLDAGSDKPLAFLPMPAEDNPALGMRGLRLSLQRPAMLAEQFRAILRGVPDAQRRIMLPMVNDLGELRRAADVLRACEAELGTGVRTPLGVMVETPAAALLAGLLAREADFLSLGTNDLSQYALAIDRGHPALVAGCDPLHPAVLKLIATAVDGAKSAGRWIGVCGAVASDPEALPMLIGLGVDEISGDPHAAPALKARVRELSAAACRDLVAAALAEADAAGVRRRLAAFLEDAIV